MLVDLEPKAKLNNSIFLHLFNNIFPCKNLKILGFGSNENIFPLLPIFFDASNVVVPIFAPISMKTSSFLR